MKSFVIAFSLVSSTLAFAVESKDTPTLAEPQSVVVAAEETSATDTHIRRRGLFGRRYIVVTHTVSSGETSTKREVVDGCCNTVRSRTVTRTGSTCNCNK